MSSIRQLCSIFYNNPKKSYLPRDFKTIEGFNQNSTRGQLRRLLEYRIIRQKLNGKYILDDSDKALTFINASCYTFRSTPYVPPSRIRGKSHNISIGHVDMSGEPLEWMLKMNMLSPPSSKDRALQSTLRPGVAEKFNMTIPRQEPSKARIYPKAAGWEVEFLDMFSWCEDFIKRLPAKALRENVEIAINYEDLQEIRPDLADIPFEDIKGVLLNHKGMNIQLCASQFTEGEICIRADTIEETMSLVDKIAYGNRDLSQAMKETAFEKRVFTEIGHLGERIDKLSLTLVQTLSDSIEKAVKNGIRGGFEESMQKTAKPDDKIDVI